MNISFSISPAPSITNKIAIVVYRADAPTVPVDSQEFSPPHNSPRNITFTNLEPVVHIVNTYETTGLPTLGTLRHSFIYNPEFQDLYIKVQYLQMVEGGTSYDVPDASWDDYRLLTLVRRGFGEMVPNVEVAIRDVTTPKGFDLLQSGDQFGDGEIFIPTLISKITTQTPIFNVPYVVYGERIITNDATIVSADSGKAIRLQGASGVLSFTASLPAIGAIAAWKTFVIISDGGDHINVTIDAGTDVIKLYPYTTPRHKIHLRQGEVIWLTTNSTQWILTQQAPKGILEVGYIQDSYSRVSPWQVFADGSLLPRAHYRALWEYVQSLSSGSVVSDSAWLAGAFGCYSTGDSSTTFRIPRMYATGFGRGVDGSARVPGVTQQGGMQQHSHYMFGEDSGGGGNLSTTNKYSKKSAALGGNTSYNMQGNASPIPTLGLTGNAYSLVGSVWVPSTIADETRPSNFGVYKLINI